ncbi:hypothetical protein KY335_04290 [Candidatus Woesearchaeota archaeon]|nr:hypothetical protein [Candidatus Woesearchaeota archaeon]
MMKKLIVFILMLVLCSSVVFAQNDDSRTNTILNALGAAKIGGGILIGFEAAFSPDYESVIVPGEEDRAIYIKGVIKQVPKIQYETLGKIFLKVPEKKPVEEPKVPPVVTPGPGTPPEPEPVPEPYPKFKRIQDPDSRIYYPAPVDDAIPVTDIIDKNGDGIIDETELNDFITYMSTTYNIDLADFDEDGIPDAFEIMLGTNPLKADSDGDGIPDNVELSLGFSPTNYDEITQSFDASPYVEGDDIFVNEKGQVSSLGIFVPDSEVIVKVYDPSGTELEEEFTTIADSTGRIKVETGAKPSAIITVEGQIKVSE